jgi:autotransporter-associated beta strand protein
MRSEALVLAAGAAVTIGSLATSALGQTYTWPGSATGNFGDGTRWVGGTAPPLSDPATVLVFTSGNAGPITATNNIGTPLMVNSLTFNVNNAFQINGSPTTNVFQLVGPPATISMSGVGTGKTVAGAGIQLTTDLALNVAGPGTLDLSGALTESGGAHSVTISGTNPRRAWSLVNLGAANGFTGGLTLDGGVVTTTNGNVTTFGANGSTLTVTANGGTIGTGALFSTTLGAIQLNGDLRFVQNGGLTLAGSGGVPTAIKGSGTIYIQTPGATITVNGNSGATAASPFTGAVVIGMSELPQMTLNNAGSLSLAGVSAQNAFPNGSLNSAASFDVRSGGQVVLNNSTINSVQNGDRIADTAPVTLHSAGLGLLGAAAAGVNGYQPGILNERIGTLTGAGHCTITMTPTASTNVTTTLEANSLVRLDRGTFNLRGTALGDNATATRGRIVVDATGAGTFTDNLVGGGGSTAQNISILPYAVGGASASDLGTSLVTWGADGFRPLNTSTEYYSTDLAPSDPTVNVRLTATTANSSSQTINALVLGPAAASPDASVTGAGTLTITSGAVVSTGTHMSSLNQQSISNNLAFGNAEAVIYTVGQGGLKITGQLTGTNGLTKSSNGTAGGTNNNNILNLTADNSGLTGPLTINGGYVLFGSDLNLPGRNTGPTLDPIIVNGSNVSSTGAATGMFYAGASNGQTGLASITTTLNRPITVESGMFTVLVRDVTLTQANWVNLGSLALAGPITGAGGLNYQGQTLATGNPAVTIASDIYVTGTSNTYSGTSRFAASNTHIYGEGSLGTGPWEFGGGTLVLEGGDQTNSRLVNFSLASGIDTNGHNLTLNGPITGFTAGTLTPMAAGSGGFTKKGSGTLTLSSLTNTLAGPVTVSAGTLIVNGNLGASATDALTIASGATLGGSGTIYRNTTVNGTLAPGNSPGILTVSGTLTLGSGAAFNVDLNGPVAGTGYDQVVQTTQTASAIATTVLGTGATLNVSLGYAPSASDMFWLINNTNALGTATTTTGNFVGLNEGDTVTLGTVAGKTYTAHISYNGNFATGLADHSGNDVVLYGVDWTPRCGTADFNCDGDVGTDADIEAFFACLAGSCPALPCTSTADFNADGDVGTDADIESFFRVLSGGPC